MGNPESLAFRAIPSRWEVQILYVRDHVAVKGVHIMIRDGGFGEEFAQLMSNLAQGANWINQMVRGKGQNAKCMAWNLTMGRLLIIGDEGLTLQKTIVSQKEAHQATKMHGAKTFRNKKTSPRTPTPDKNLLKAK